MELMGKCEGQQKEDENEGLEQGDKISNLPDHVIECILSFLGIKEAIRTSVVSSRWRYLWKGITRVCILSSDFPVDNFVKFVNHVLFNHTSMNLEELQLHCPSSIDLFLLGCWIYYVQQRVIKKLILYVDMPAMELPKGPFPACVLSCSSLVSLELRSYFDIFIPESVSCFPCLKSLRLTFIAPYHDDAMHRLFSCCPVLEDLRLDGHLDFPEKETLHIYIPSLKRLTLWLWIQEDEIDPNNNYKIIIDTPNLEYLCIDDHSLPWFVLKNLDRLCEAHVKLYFNSLLPGHINRVIWLFSGFASTRLLSLDWSTLDLLQSALNKVRSQSRLGHAGPSFQSLICLILDLSATIAWDSLSILHSAPFLKILILDLEGFNAFTDRDDDTWTSEWTPLNPVPYCLLHCLNEIGIDGFEGNEDELQAVEYLLKNSEVLELMIIGFHPYPKNEEVVKKLLAFPKASKACCVKVYERFGYGADISYSQIKTTLFGVFPLN